MGTRLLLLLSSAVLCSGECRQIGPPQFGRIEISAFSMLGESLPTIGIDLIEVGTQKSFKSQFHGAVAKKIPYGTYTLRVSAPGFRSVQRELRLDQPEVFVRSQLPVSIECGGFAEIGGSVKSAPKDRELWVKLVPLIGVGDAEVRVSREGLFQASGLNDGRYILLVVDGTTVVHTESVDMSGSKRVIVDLVKVGDYR